MPADVAIEPIGQVSAPAAWALPLGTDIVLGAVRAHFDGTSAASAFVPILQLILPNGDTGPEFPSDAPVAAGGSVDCTWFPGLGGGGGGGGTLGTEVIVPVDTPDASGNAFATLTTRQGYSTTRRVLPSFWPGADATWSGGLKIPADYGSAGTLTLSWSADATAGVLRATVATNVIPISTSYDTGYTTETYVNTTVPATALQRFDVSYILSSAPAAGDVMNVQVTRNGANVADTLAVPAQLFQLVFSYTAG